MCFVYDAYRKDVIDEGTCYRESAQCSGDEGASLEELFCLANQTCRSHAATVSTGELMRAERDTLHQYAVRKGISRTPDEFRDTCVACELCSLGGGNEHDVLIYSTGQRVLKITKPGNGYGARSRLTDYLENHLMANVLFGDDVRLEYAVYSERGDEMPMLVISQPFIEGTKASVDEISSFWEALDFHECGQHAYRHPCGTSVYDARPDNIYKDKSGYLFPIDVQVFHGIRYLHYKILRNIGVMGN